MVEKMASWCRLVEGEENILILCVVFSFIGN